ncbi:MAG: hypothetical protein ACI9M9_000978 [Flavobacteriaceae bacterium]|jgi:hypothetical protein
MLKKLFPCLIFALLSCTVYSQTIVSTTPENKKVILEEFTGIHCVWCPSGHAIAKAIQDSNPGNVFLINIHTGGFSNPGPNEPDFRTTFGNAIRSQSGVNFYPSGTVNRHVFSGGITGMDRGQWTSRANSTLTQPSYVNVAVEADINVQTQELTVHVEGYYTANSPQGTNLLNIALLQNNTKGPQTGGNAGSNYNHMHRLVYLLTGQWGISIPSTTTSTFVDETVTYSIPADYNGIAVELGDLEIVAFIAETQQEIASGAGAFPTYSGFANSNDAFARYVNEVDDQCGFDITPSVNIQNIGSDPLTSLSINYSVNSGPVETYNWSGSITSLQNETVELPGIGYTVNPAGNTFEVTLGSDDNNSNNTASGTFENAVTATGSVTLILNSGTNGSQITWDITNSGGTVLYSGGPYLNSQSFNIPLTFSADCHKFEVRSANGNGGSSVVMYDSDSQVLYSSTGDFGFGESSSFNSDGVVVLGINDTNFEGLSIYPNPASSVLNISNAENSTIEVYNILGQILYTKNDISIEEQIQVSQFTTGTYFVKITNGNAVKTIKFIKR